jgi:hypothetical protein
MCYLSSLSLGHWLTRRFLFFFTSISPRLVVFHSFFFYLSRQPATGCWLPSVPPPSYFYGSLLVLVNSVKTVAGQAVPPILRPHLSSSLLPPPLGPAPSFPSLTGVPPTDVDGSVEEELEIVHPQACPPLPTQMAVWAPVG